MFCNDPQCKIFYTKDSSDPVISSTSKEYSAISPILLHPGNHHIRAVTNVSKSGYYGYSNETKASCIVIF